MAGVKYCLVPGEIQSVSDGDTHYVGAPQLAQLYRLARGSWRTHNDLVNAERCAGLVHLYPRADGQYYHPDSPLSVGQDSHGMMQIIQPRHSAIDEVKRASEKWEARVEKDDSWFADRDEW